MTKTAEAPAALEKIERFDVETGAMIESVERPARAEWTAPARFGSEGPLCSPTTGELFTALAKAQGEITNALKDTTGQTGQQLYQYATLGNVLDVSRKPLAANGLAVVQRTRTVEGGVEISTMLTHSSGEWLADGGLFLPCAADSKAIGSAITYGRRYAYMSLVGVAGEDDDGTTASESTPAGTTAKKTRGKGKAATAGKAAAAAAPASKFGELTEWRWGKEKGTPLGLVTEKSLEWLIGQEKYGNDDDRAAAKAELESRQQQRVPQGAAEGEGAPDTGEAPATQEAPPEADLTDESRGTLVELLISSGLAPDEDAGNALIDEKGDGTEAWATRQIGLLRQRQAESEGTAPAGDA